MRKFIRTNQLISITFVCSVIVIILYIVSIESKEWFPHAGDWFNVVFQLAIGFIINFMFYITQVYVPQLKQREQAYKCIVLQIEEIIGKMNEMFLILANKYIDGIFDVNNISDEQLKTILNKLNTVDTVGMLNVHKLNSSNPHFISRVEYVESYINRLSTYYSLYITPELMVILNEILMSNMHNNMARLLLQNPNPTVFCEYKEDDVFKPYYWLLKRLKTAKKYYSST